MTARNSLALLIFASVLSACGGGGGGGGNDGGGVVTPTNEPPTLDAIGDAELLRA